MYENYLDAYLEQNLAVIPVRQAEKRTFINGWQENPLTEDEIRNHFNSNPDLNIAIVLGRMSGDIVDVDLDSECAILAGDLILPHTDLVFGRNSKPNSHHVYRVTNLGQSASYRNPITNAMDVELRGNGRYTVFPGSIHPSGEAIAFTSQGFRAPSISDFREISRAVKDVAAVCTLAELWNSGSRHNVCLAFSGFCAKNNISYEDCVRIIKVVCQIKNDEDIDDRLRCIQDTYVRSGAEKSISQRDKGTVVFEPKVITTLKGLLDVKSLTELARVPSSPSRLECLYSEAAFAKQFTFWLAGRIIFSVDDNCFYLNRYGIFSQISAYEVSGFVLDFLEEIAEGDLTSQDQKLIATFSTNAKVNAIVNLSRTLLRADAKAFNSDRNLVGCRNGVLDLETGSLIEPTSIVTHSLNTTFDPAATCPNFERFVSQVMGGDEDMIAYLKRALGYSLSGYNNAQCMFVGIGRGANGKSTLLNVIQALFGEYSVSTPMHTLMVSKFGGERTDDLAQMQHKRLVSAQEGEANQSLAVAKIKQMTGGDRLSCRRLYGNLFEYEPQFKLWLFTNELPRVPGGDNALWRRLHIINFSVTIPEAERDTKLGETLAKELVGILNWLLDGYRDFISQGLNPPSKVTSATKSYQQDSDVVLQFVDSACVRVDVQTSTMTADLYGSFVRWCGSSGIEPITNSMFGKELERLGFAKKATNKGTARRGIILKDDPLI